MPNVPKIVYNKTFGDIFFQQLLKYFRVEQTDKSVYLYWCEIVGDYNRSPAKDFYAGDFVKYFETEHLKNIRNGNAVLVISTCQETFSPTDEYDIPEYLDVDLIIEQECLRNNIPLENVIWICGDLHAGSRAKGNITTYGYSCYSHDFDYLLTGIKYDFFDSIVPFDRRQFDKDYICFQRWMKSGRVYLLNKLWQESLLDNGYVSCPDKMFGDTFEKRSNTFLNRIRKFSSKLTRSEVDISRLESNLKIINQIVPLTLDVQDFESNFCAGLDTLLSSKTYYETSFFSVISEAQIEGSAVYISEAAYRPFLYGHPAIWVAQPGTIKELRAQGYETWDWLVDESYDQEPYMLDRIDMCVDQIKKLISIEKPQSLLERIQEQNLYNRDIMSNRSLELQKTKLIEICNSKIQH